MRLFWLQRAEADVEEIFDYLVERDPNGARRVYEAIQRQVALLADQPGIGRAGRVADTRELVISRTPYIVAYTVDRRIDAVIVLRVLHAARQWPKDLFQI
jgi:toxin ParE1/3/4